MKPIVRIFFDYLELAVASILIITLFLVIISGVVKGGMSWIPVVLSLGTLTTVGIAFYKRRKKSTKEAETRPSNLLRIVIILLFIASLGTSYAVDLVLNNQARVTVGLNDPGSIFNQALKIQLINASGGTPDRSPKVTAIILSDGYPELKIEDASMGDEFYYTSSKRFLIRVLEIKDARAKFYVRRFIF